MKKSVVLLLAIAGIVSFQNCGRMATVGDGSVNAKDAGVERTYEIPLVNVRPGSKSDSSQPTEVILDGYFSDGCPAELSPAIESNGAVHRVRALVKRVEYSDQVCTLALREFEEKVSLGNLPTGDHTIQFETSDGPRQLVITVD